MILRYTMLERVVHWVAALAYFYVLLTGLAFYSPHLYWLATVLGGGPTSRYWHPWVALLFLGTLGWMLRAWIADMRINESDRAWSQAIDRYVRNQDQDLPPIDRFNLGQKYFFWAMIFAGLLLLASGIVMWVPERIPVPAVRGAAVVLHAAAALVTIGAFIIHVYMGTAVVRGGFTSIIRGEVTPAWAKTHHRLWYYRITGK